MKLNRLIDHTLLNASATEANILKLCDEARKHNFYSVCINSSYVNIAKQALGKSDVKICTVVGFPLGAMVKTSTGFSKSGATLTAIKIIKKTVRDKLKIKVSGGIRDAETAKKYIDLGADRIGASLGVLIMKEIEQSLEINKVF